MSNLVIYLDISTMEWTDTNGRALETGDECPIEFAEGVFRGTTYTNVELHLQNGEWKQCSSSTSESSPMTVAVPAVGTAEVHSFCVSGSLTRKGWFDPKLKLKNKDASGVPSSYPQAQSCDCGS